MDKFINFRNEIKKMILIINEEYKEVQKSYVATPEEANLRAFLEDLWFCPKVETEQTECRKEHVIQLVFIDRYNASNVYNLRYSLTKMNPRLKSTTPLWFLVGRLAKANFYHFYFSPNLFTNKTRKHYESYIRFSKSYFVDIDADEIDVPIYNYSREEIVTFLSNKYDFLNEKFFPSYIIMSGRGLHLYFTLNQAERFFPKNKQNKDIHKKITKELISKFSADYSCSNLNRILRVPFSLNAKNNIRTRLFVFPEYRNIYSKELLEQLLNIEPIIYEQQKLSQQNMEIEKEKKKSYKKYTVKAVPEDKKQYAIKGFLNLYNYRQDDLEKWFYMHCDNMRGRRHNFFLIYSRVLLCLGHRSNYVTGVCEKMNKKLKEPLSSDELNQIVECKTKYIYSGEKIRKLLQFTDEEIADFKAHYTEEGIREYAKKYRDNLMEEKRTEKEIIKKEKEDARQREQRRRFQIIEENPQLSYSQLGERMGVSKSTVCRVMKEYDKIKSQ